MSDAQLWSWIVTLVGVVGWWLVGKKLWWSWYVGLGTQVLWTIYATVSAQPAFYVSVLLYTAVYGKNAWMWTKEHLAQKKRKAQLVADFRKKMSDPPRVTRIWPPNTNLNTPIQQRFGTWTPGENDRDNRPYTGPYLGQHSGTSVPPDVIYHDGDEVPIEMLDGSTHTGFIEGDVLITCPSSCAATHPGKEHNKQ